MFAVEDDRLFFRNRKQLQSRAYGVEGDMDCTGDMVGGVLSLGADIDDQRCWTFQELFLQIGPGNCSGASGKRCSQQKKRKKVLYRFVEVFHGCSYPSSR